MGNGIGPLMNLQNQPLAQSPTGQPNQPADPNQEKVKQLLAMMTQMAARTGAGGTSNVGMPKPPAPRPSTNVQFGGAAAGIMGIIESIKGRKNAIEAQKAESYYSQISSFLQPTGDPNTDAQNRQKAELFLSDPKIQKTLEKGLGYFQLMEPEEPPAEAIGIHKAMQKDKSKQSQGQPQQRPRPALPQGGPMGNQEQMLKLLQGITNVQGTMAGTKATETSTQKIQQEIGSYKDMTDANLRNINTQSDLTKWELENKKDLAPDEKKKLENDLLTQKAEQDRVTKQSKLYDAEASYYRSGKITPQYTLNNFKTALEGLDKSVSGQKALYDKAQSDWSKFQNWQNQYNKSGTGISADILNKLGFNKMEDYNNELKTAQAIYDRQRGSYLKALQARQGFAAMQAQITSGAVPLSKAIASAYQAAGADIPNEVVQGMTADAPNMSDLDNEIMNLLGTP